MALKLRLAQALDAMARSLGQSTGAQRTGEAPFRFLFENAPVLIHVVDQDRRIQRVNDTWLKTLGYERDEVIGREITQFMAPQSAPTLDRLDMPGGTEPGLMTDVSCQFVRKNGELADVLLSSHAERGAQGHGGQTVVALVDVTRRKRAEEQLAEKTSLLDGLVRYSHAVISIKDSERRYLLVNPEFEKVVGVSNSQARGKTVYDLFPKRSADLQVRHEDRMIETGAPVTQENVMQVADGTVKTFLTMRFPVFDQAGKLIAIGGMGADITEMKATDERFRRYFELPLVGSAIYTPEKQWFRVNDKFCDLLGYSREELMELTWAELTHADDLAENIRLFDEAIAGVRDTYSMDKRFIRKNGEVLHTAISVQCLRRPDGAADYFILLVLDLTERKRAEDQIRRLNQDLEQRVQRRTAELHAAQEELVRQERLAAVGDLTASVSHELRNPLGALRSAVDAIGKLTGGGDDRLRRAVELAERSITRCNNIIGDLLDYSRVRNLQLEATALDGWLGALLDEYEPPAGITLRRELGCGAAPAIDRERMRHVMINLLDNACQATADPAVPGAGEAVVTVASRLVGDRLELSVADTGPGVAPEQAGKIFEPLHSTKAFGIGLGLAIVKRIAEQHDGAVRVENATPRGARFVVSLPLREPARSGPPQETEKAVP